MPTSHLTDKQTAVLTRIADLLPGSKPSWWPSENPFRVYLDPGRRDAKVYIDFDDPAAVFGPAVKIVVNPASQPESWLATQRKRLGKWAAPAFLACLQIGAPPETVAAYLAELAATDPETHADLVEMISE